MIRIYHSAALHHQLSIQYHNSKVVTFKKNNNLNQIPNLGDQYFKLNLVKMIVITKNGNDKFLFHIN